MPQLDTLTVWKTADGTRHYGLSLEGELRASGDPMDGTSWAVGDADLSTALAPREGRRVRVTIELLDVVP